MLDGNARQNLATFCQTREEPELLALMALSVNKNMIDRDEYPQTAEIERRCVHMMADLWNAPEAANTRRSRPPSTGRIRGSCPRSAPDARRPVTHLG